MAMFLLAQTFLIIDQKELITEMSISILNYKKEIIKSLESDSEVEIFAAISLLMSILTSKCNNCFLW